MDAKQIDRTVQRQGLPGAGGRPRHARRQGRTEAGRPDQGRRRQAGRRRRVAPPRAEQDEAQTPDRRSTVKSRRQGASDCTATLGRRPLEVIRPEGRRSALVAADLAADSTTRSWPARRTRKSIAVGEEMKGMNLWSSNWTVVVDRRRARSRSASVLPGCGPGDHQDLSPRPRCRTNQIGNPDYPAYHLVFDIEIRNTRRAGPQGGLPARRPERPADRRLVVRQQGQPRLGRRGLRDVVVSFDGGTPEHDRLPDDRRRQGPSRLGRTSR